MAGGQADRNLIRLERVRGTLPDGLVDLQDKARAEGYRMLDRLAAEWASGTNRFAGPGEALWAAYRGDRLAAIGGVTIEPGMPGAFRMRRFFVEPADRRYGVARRLARALLAALPPGCAAVTVNAAAGSEAFWEALGFVQVPSATWTHLRMMS